MRTKLIAAFLLIFGLLLGGSYFTLKPYYDFATQTLAISPLKTLLPSTVKTINNQMNILVLGIAGGDHDGPNLSDSITVAHYDFTTNTLTTIGIPRDMWSDTLKEKINAAYAIGEAIQKGGGLKLAKAEVGALLGLPISYGVVINFSSFEKLIDYLGGIDIVVEHSFTDRQFPITGKENDLCGGDLTYGCRYETLQFNKGVNHMNGETALKFTRSRHAEGSEGSDFARSNRQQLVLQAVKEKILSVVKTKDLKKIIPLYTTINSLVERDISNQDGVFIAKNIVLKKNFTQVHLTIPQNALYVPSYDDYDGKYVLVPQDKDSKNFHQLVTCLIQYRKEESCTAYLKTETKEQ
ncbi:LCP family protein [Candidatus Roizmanbacteria bacterium]|nr:LCP family protein [Candidatus Roizmanbacteria bacterium]